MTNKQIFEDYCRFLPYFDRNVDSLASIFGVSVPTIRKWQLQDSNVPKYAVVIISKLKEIHTLNTDLKQWKQKHSVIKNDVNVYLSALSRLESHNK